MSSTSLRSCFLCCISWFSHLSQWTKSSSVIIEMKATEEYFPVVLFLVLYKMVLAFASVGEIVKCDH